MEKNAMTTRKALVVVSVLIFLIGATLVVPAKLVGVKNKRAPLILRSQEELLALSGDSNRNNIPDWKDLLTENTSTSTKVSRPALTDETKKRLADPNNLTSSFSKNVYTASTYASKNGKLTPKQQDELASSLIAGEESKIIVKTYEVKDLTIAKNESETSRKEYGNVLGKIAKNAEKFAVSEDDLTILKSFNVNKDASVLATLVVKKNNVSLVINEMLKVSVPYSAVPYHLLVVNKLSQYQSVLENMSQAKEDPLRASIAFKEYFSVVKSALSSFMSIRNYFLLENITFTKSEPGYAITH